MAGDSYLAHVVFAFPLHLGMLDRTFAYTFEEMPCFVRVRCSYGARTFQIVPEAERDGEIKRNWFEIRATQPDGKEILARKICYATFAERFIEEVMDTMGIAFFDVIFVRPGDPPKDEGELAALRRAALLRVQEFVRYFRVELNDFNVPIPTGEDAFGSRSAWATEFKITDKGAEGNFTSVTPTIYMEKAGRTGVAKPLVSPEQCNELLKRLRSQNAPRLHDELLIEAIELTKLHDDHRLSVVVAQTGFETYVQWRVKGECNSRGIEELDSRRFGLRSVDDVVTRAGIKELLGEYFRQLAGPGLQDLAEYKEWDVRAYEVRNAIIHQGRRAVTAEEAAAAWKAVSACTSVVNRLLNDSRARIQPGVRRRKPGIVQRIGRLLQRLGSRLAS